MSCYFNLRLASGKTPHDTVWEGARRHSLSQLLCGEVKGDGFDEGKSVTSLKVGN